MPMITISLTLPEDKLLSVYALLGGTALVAPVGKPENVGNPSTAAASTASADTAVAGPSTPSVIPADVGTSGDATTSTTATATASPSDVPPPPPPVDEEPEASVADGNGVDAKGVPFDPTLHTGTLKKDGTWRLKKGAAAAEEPAGRGLNGRLAATDETPPPPPPAVDEDDEFAAFASQAAAPAAPVARKWTDADLSKLCNQGASKDGNPDRVKAIIAKYVPAGEVQHSRNIPTDVREAFAQELEATIGIQYAG